MHTICFRTRSGNRSNAYVNWHSWDEPTAADFAVRPKVAKAKRAPGTAQPVPAPSPAPASQPAVPPDTRQEPPRNDDGESSEQPKPLFILTADPQPRPLPEPVIRFVVPPNAKSPPPQGGNKRPRKR